MSLEEKLATLDEGLRSEILSLIESEREKSIAESRKRNAENAALRKYKMAMEEFGIDNPDELKSYITKKPKMEDDTPTMKSLKAELDRMRAERDQERLFAKNKRLEADLTNAIGDKLYASKYIIKSLISDGLVDIIDGEIIYKDGETHLSIEQGIQKILNDNKESLKSNIVPGAKTTMPNSQGKGNLDSVINSNDPNAIKANFAEIAKEIGLKI